MRILVTGGAGFIGSSLANRLCTLGHEVTAADNLFLGDSANLDSRVRFVQASVTDAAAMDALFATRYGAVFHFAAISSAPMYADGKAPDPAEWCDVNITGFARVLKHTSRQGAHAFYSSTSSIYSGNPLPYREDQPIVPKTMYEATLYAREMIASAFRHSHGLRSAGFRFFAVYGMNERHKGPYANLVSQFLWAMKKGERPVIYGDGSQTRDFIHVNDVVDALILAMDARLEGVYNVGTGTAHPLNELVSKINKALGTSLTPAHVHNPLKNYVEHTLADVTKLRSRGFTAKITLDDGIRMMLG